MKKEDDLRDSEHGVAVGTRWAGLSISETLVYHVPQPSVQCCERSQK